MPDPQPSPQPKAQPLVTVACDCGWTDTFSRGYSGLVVECPRCGRMHRVAMFRSGTGADSQDEIEIKRVMDQLLRQQQRDDAVTSDAVARVSFKPFFMASAGLCAVAVLVAALFARPFYPLGVVIVGGVASWPLGLWVAWLGQRKQLRRLAKAQTQGR